MQTENEAGAPLSGGQVNRGVSGRCATCDNWGNNRNYAEDDGARIKSCNCPKFVYGYHYDKGDVPNDGAAIEDDEGWGMLTGSEFGCIHWVPANADLTGRAP